MPATAEQSPPQASQKTRFKINRENARTLSLKGWELRRERQEQARIALAKARLELDYREQRLLRVRDQLDSLDKEIELAIKAKDAKQLRDLVQAQNQLSQQEQMLSMRPGPGTIKPLPERRASGRPTIEMEE